jgi:hypothetical protein
LTLRLRPEVLVVMRRVFENRLEESKTKRKNKEHNSLPLHCDSDWTLPLMIDKDPVDSSLLWSVLGSQAVKPSCWSTAHAMARSSSGAVILEQYLPVPNKWTLSLAPDLQAGSCRVLATMQQSVPSFSDIQILLISYNSVSGHRTFTPSSCECFFGASVSSPNSSWSRFLHS